MSSIHLLASHFPPSPLCRTPSGRHSKCKPHPSDKHTTAIQHSYHIQEDSVKKSRRQSRLCAQGGSGVRWQRTGELGSAHKSRRPKTKHPGEQFLGRCRPWACKLRLMPPRGVPQLLSVSISGGLNLRSTARPLAGACRVRQPLPCPPPPNPQRQSTDRVVRSHYHCLVSSDGLRPTRRAARSALAREVGSVHVPPQRTMQSLSSRKNARLSRKCIIVHG